LHGDIQTIAEQTIGNFTGVTTGAFFVQIDGKYLSITGISLASALNMNGVASAVQTALRVALANTVCVWNSTTQRFDITSPSTGVASSVSLAAAPTATGSYASGSVPANSSIITINGTAVTFTTGTPSAGQVKIGIDVPTTLANLLTVLNASTDSNLILMNYTVVGSTLYVKSVLTGTPGNTYTITAGTVPASNFTASAATLAGGTGTDISTLLGFAGVGSGPVVAGSALETPLACVSLHDDMFSQQWYGLMFALATPLGDSDNEAVASYIEGSSFAHTFGVTITNTNVLSSSVTTDTASNLQALLLSRTFCAYSSTASMDVAS